MKFIIEQVQQIGMVAVIMICAVGGTIGILKLIQHFSPGKELPKDPISKKLDKEQKKDKE